MNETMELGIVLTADGKGLKGELKVTEKQLSKLGTGVAKVDKQSTKAARSIAKMKTGMGGLRRTAGGLVRSMTGLSGLFAGLSAAGVAATFISAASTAEKYKVRLSGLLGSQAEGNRLFKEMADYASKVPFEYEKVMESATQLAGIMDGGVDEIKEWMPLIGDLAAASGMTIEDTTGQIARMFSSGAASADMFREKGILSMLGFQAKTAYSIQETRTMLMEAWKDPQSKFAGLADELGNTWSGMLSMLSDKWFQVRTTIMDAGVFDYLKELVRVIDGKFNDALNTAKDSAKTWSENAIGGIEGMVIAFAHLADIWDFFMIGLGLFPRMMADFKVMIADVGVLLAKINPKYWMTGDDTGVLRAQVEQYNAQQKSLELLNKMRERANRNISEEVKETMASLRAAAADRTAKAEAAKGLVTLTKNRKKNTTATVTAKKAEDAYQTSLKKTGEAMTKSLRTPMEQYSDDMYELYELKEAGAISTETLTRREAELAEQLKEITGDVQDQIPEIFNLGEAWLQIQKNLQTGFSDLFVGMFHGEFLGSIEDFGKQILDIFLKLIADIAAAWIASKVFGGSLNLGGLGGGGTGGGGIIGSAASSIAGSAAGKYVANSAIGQTVAGWFGGGSAATAASVPSGYVAGTGMGSTGTMGGTMVQSGTTTTGAGSSGGAVASGAMGALGIAAVVALYDSYSTKKSAELAKEVAERFSTATDIMQTDIVTFGKQGGELVGWYDGAERGVQGITSAMRAVNVELEHGAGGALILSGNLETAQAITENYTSATEDMIATSVDGYVKLNAMSADASEIRGAEEAGLASITAEWAKSVELVNSTKFDGLAKELERVKGISSTTFKAISKDGWITAKELAADLGWSAKQIEDALGGAAQVTVSKFLELQGAARDSAGTLTGEFEGAGKALAGAIESGVSAAQNAIDGMTGTNIRSTHTITTIEKRRAAGDAGGERAEGGMVNSPEVSLIGEAGRELVLPNSVTEFFMKNGVPINSGNGGGNDKQIADRLDIMIQQNSKLEIRLASIEGITYQAGQANVEGLEDNLRQAQENAA